MADAIIAEINDPMCNAEIDLDAVLSRHKENIDAMPEEIGAPIYLAAASKREGIKATLAKAKAKETLV